MTDLRFTYVVLNFTYRTLVTHYESECEEKNKNIYSLIFTTIQGERHIKITHEPYDVDIARLGGWFNVKKPYPVSISLLLCV